MKYFAGIDIGSLTCDVVILNENKKIVGYSVVLTGARNAVAMKTAFLLAVKEAGISSEDIFLKAFTGYGRELATDKDLNITEISCHAKGANFLFPKTKVVIDVGGQDVKVIRIDSRGRVKEFVMNDKCAAGTGRFIETMARALELDLDKYSMYPHITNNTLTISSYCTVFAESEIVSLIANGEKVEKIVTALNDSIAKRILSLVERVPIEKEITITGGVANNQCIVSALEYYLRLKINKPLFPQIVGALGAAIIALNSTTKEGRNG